MSPHPVLPDPRFNIRRTIKRSTTFAFERAQAVCHWSFCVWCLSSYILCSWCGRLYFRRLWNMTCVIVHAEIFINPSTYFDEFETCACLFITTFGGVIRHQMEV